MKRTPAFKPFPTTKAPHPEYKAVTPPVLSVFLTIEITPCFCSGQLHRSVLFESRSPRLLLI